MLCVGAAGLHHAVEGIFALQWVLVTSRLVDQLLAATVHQFKCGQDFRQLTLGLLERSLHIFVVLDTKVSHVHGLRTRWTLDRNTGDDANGTFRADEQLLKIVACVVLPQSRK